MGDFHHETLDEMATQTPEIACFPVKRSDDGVIQS